MTWLLLNKKSRSKNNLSRLLETPMIQTYQELDRDRTSRTPRFKSVSNELRAYGNWSQWMENAQQRGIATSLCLLELMMGHFQSICSSMEVLIHNVTAWMTWWCWTSSTKSGFQSSNLASSRETKSVLVDVTTSEWHTTTYATRSSSSVDKATKEPSASRIWTCSNCQIGLLNMILSSGRSKLLIFMAS